MWGLVSRALFTIDPEEAHDLVRQQLVRLQQIPFLLHLVTKFLGERAFFSPVELWGLRFESPLGLAAGFDKNAEMVPFLRALGFGFIEVGTVTLHPQRGNPKPRVFRYPAERALVNRLGFNNDGATVIASRAAALAGGGPLFVNIGKNRDVPLGDAAQAYRHCYRVVAPECDGVVVNLSSPNTPGLRDLQRPAHLREILRDLRRERTETRFRKSGVHPLLVKIAPDLNEEELGEIAEVCLELADGMVVSNTTIQRPDGRGEDFETGGLSGRPLFRISTDVLREIRAVAGRDYPLIGVGGIFGAEEVREKLAAGANLVECYTGFIYEGPGLLRSIARDFKKVNAA